MEGGSQEEVPLPQEAICGQESGTTNGETERESITSRGVVMIILLCCDVAAVL